MKAHCTPAAIHSIFDQFQRRSELCTGRLIGACYGNRTFSEGQEEITIKQAFPVPHSELNGQVNVNGDYYKNRAELIRTCYGRSQYILGWYSIRMVDAPCSPEGTAFIHDVFCKEVNKASPVTAANAAVHLEIVIDAAGGIKCRLWTGLNASQLICEELPVQYGAEDAALLTRNQKYDWSVLRSAINDESLLKRLPNEEAYTAKATEFKNDLAGLKELSALLIDQLKQSGEIYLQ